MASDSDLRWMQHALALARRAEEAGEVPVGAVVIRDDTLVAEGWNQPISSNDPTAHAEIVALRCAAQETGNYRLTGHTLYVTLEPCIMCAGAIIHSRIDRVVFGALDPKAGAVSSVYDVLSVPRLNHHAQCEGGMMEAECSQLLRNFFRARRA